MEQLGLTEWYDIARDTNWTPRYVPEDELFPDDMSDSFQVPRENWERFDEPYKITYREYVDVQHKKDDDAYSVRAALTRSRFFDEADPGWRTSMLLHYASITIGELGAGLAEAKMARFGKAPGMRNMATFGLLDEIRHTQMQLYFAHENISKDPRFDWVQKTYHSDHWAAIAARANLDDVELSRDAASIGLMLTFATEEGLTNLQFLGLSAEAHRAGDYNFSNLIANIQTDETRHAQIGAAVLRVLIENGKTEEAQRLVDIAWWRQWRLFATVGGPTVDYYTPLHAREKSFKEFALEFIAQQFERVLLDLGLDLPWFWDDFLESLDTVSHATHLAFWFWRAAQFWNPTAGVSKAEREWLEEKYPGWNDTFGASWDVIERNLSEGREDLTFPQCVPAICNTCAITMLGTPNRGISYRNYWSHYEGRRYVFCSRPCKWIFDEEPERIAGHRSVVDRLYNGVIQPPTLDGFLRYMGLPPEERGQDAHDYSWVAERIDELG